MEKSFEDKVKIFPQEKGWFYVLLPLELSKPLAPLANRGLIAIIATVDSSCWSTSLLPLGDGSCFIPLPAKVRKKEKITLGDKIKISFTPRTKHSD